MPSAFAMAGFFAAPVIADSRSWMDFCILDAIFAISCASLIRLSSNPNMSVVVSRSAAIALTACMVFTAAFIDLPSMID